MRLFVVLILIILCGPGFCYGQDADSVAANVAANSVRRAKYRYVAQETGLFVPLAEDVPAGHYSGITYLGGTGYAVVDDKQAGNGLVLFNIDINDLGQIQSVTAVVPDCTAQSKVTGKDNEGIVYVGAWMTPADSLMKEWRAKFGLEDRDSVTAFGNTLFISAESDQSIAEYTMEGEATGRKLEVPEMFARDKIYANKGFEALAYNPVTGLFWTTTEGPLRSDGELSLVRYLQSFDRGLKPVAAVEYKMDAPRKTLAESKEAQAYVHGISAMTALDDGQLIVLERDVYVPKGGILKMALGSFAITKLYVVDPLRAVYADGLWCGNVGKTLLHSFTIGALGLANYEGICLGPVLPDGRQTLVMIADSQGGSKGRILECVKVIALQAVPEFVEE